MNPLERFVIELTGRRYKSRRMTAWAIIWRSAAVVLALGLIWLALIVAFV